jgi:tetratricopeptide (TPR) repeat protein
VQGYPEIAPESVYEDDDEPALVAALVSYDAHDWETAKVSLEPIAIAGNRLAIFKYANTLGNLGETEASEHFWRIAVAAGDTNAANNLANLLKNQGRHDEVLPLYLESAEGGSFDAMQNIGIYIQDEDPAGAEEWFLKSVAAGGVKACANLSLMYFNQGRLEEAFKYVELGIERGSIYAGTSAAMYYMNNEDWDSTLVAARRALTLANEENTEGQAHPYKMIVVALINLLRFEEAEKAIADCVSQGIDGTEEMVDWLKLMREANPEVEQQSSTQKVNFCTNCGTKAQSGSLFCTNCGTKL